MQWDDMRIFLEVARQGTISAAAKELKIDPATVSRRIARAEEDLGAVLFTKSANGYVMTQAAQHLLSHASDMETAMLAAHQKIAGTGQGLQGQIRIGAPDGLANFVLPQVCAAITQDHPDIEFQILSLPRVVNLSKREADFAIAVSPPSAGRLSVKKVVDYKLHLAASDQYLSHNAPINQLEDIADHSFVGYIPDMIFDKELDYLSEIYPGSLRYSSNSVSVQFRWLQQGAGIGIAHDFALPSAPHVQKILADQFSLQRSFYLVRHADDRRVARMNIIAERLAEEIKAEVLRLESIS